jgi:hypothetical protein
MRYVRSTRRRPLREDVAKLRVESERLTVLNRQFSTTLDDLARATVRLYSHNRRLERAEAGLRDCGAALLAAVGDGGRLG